MGRKREEGGGGGRKIGKLYASHALTLMQGIRSTIHSPRSIHQMNCAACRYKFDVLGASGESIKLEDISLLWLHTHKILPAANFLELLSGPAESSLVK